MKFSIFTLLIISCIHSVGNCQTDSLPFTYFDGKVHYQQIVEVDSSKQDALYAKAKLWIANEFKSAKEVIQLDDKDNGILLAKGSFEDNFVWQFTLKIQVKNNKYKAEIYDIDYTYYLETTGTTTVLLNDWISWPSIVNRKDKMYKPNALKFVAETNIRFESLFTSLKSGMHKNLKSDF